VTDAITGDITDPAFHTRPFRPLPAHDAS